MPYIIQCKPPGKSSTILAQTDTIEAVRDSLIRAMCDHATSLETILDPETLDAVQTVIDNVRRIDLKALPTFRAYLPTSADHDEIPTLFQVVEN